MSKWNQTHLENGINKFVLNVALKKKTKKEQKHSTKKMHTRILNLIINGNLAWKWIMIALRCNY